MIHGIIREVSLVPAGANPGAFIDMVMAHGEEVGDALILGYDENLVIYHADELDETNSKETSESEDDETLENIIAHMSEKEKNVLYGLVGEALGLEKSDSTDSAEHSNN